jgi:SAM-dependent methyltransferase
VPSSSPASPEGELRLAFGNAPADDERGRPGWPDEVAGVGDLPEAAAVLDLGAGTGKLTRVLARRFARAVAVEPDAAMRALLLQVTDCHLVLDGSAEAIPLADASVDGVFCAECFHWFDWLPAPGEIARVLRPGGVLVLCFNTPAGPTEPPFPAAARQIVRRYRRPGVHPGGRILESGRWREPFADPGSPFEQLREERFEHVHVQSREEMVAGTVSVSVFASLAVEERRSLAEQLRAALPGTTYRTPLGADVWWTRRTK